MREGMVSFMLKLLVNADNRGETLKMTSTRNNIVRTSVYHLLVANRNKFEPEVFSGILRYLCCSMGGSVLLQNVVTKIPATMLAVSLVKDGLKVSEVLEHVDFIFLIKATCYMSKPKGTPKEYHERLEETEQISLSEALTICSPRFRQDFVVEALNCVLSVDSQFLMEKDSSGQYPIHRMITDHSYFMHTNLATCVHLCLVMSVIMKHAPQCARQCNDEGLLPLHLAADLQRVPDLYDSSRVKLVSIIWNAYPEAVGIVEKSTGLPPFALAARDKKVVIGSTLSSSFFLLKQHPEIISEYIVSSGEQTCSAVPPAKRLRKAEK